MYQLIALTLEKILRLFGCKTINRQFTLSYALIFMLAALSGISLYFSMSINPQTLNLAGRQRMLSQRVAKETLLVVAQAEQLATLRQTLALFESSHRSIIEGNAALGMNALENPDILQQMEHVGQLWLRYKQTIERHVSENSRDTLMALKEQSPVILHEMNKAVVMMTDEASRTNQLQLLIALSSVAGILLLVLFGRIFGLRMLMDNIQRLQARMSEVGNGNFSHRFAVSHSDNEIGQMFNSYNQMLDHVSELLRSVQDVACNTEQHIDGVVKATSDASQGVSLQYADIELVAAAMTEMSATVQEVANNALEAEEAAAQTSTHARHGGEIVGQSQLQAQQMKETLQQTEQRIQELEEETQAVGKVTSVISGIAEQTNLLALNAAIEAARAGDQGRGFAVVADEVRTLAQRTQQSTQEIQTIIERLQIKADHAVNSMGQSTELAERSSALAKSAADALEQIITSAATISSMNTMISTATEEQSCVAADIDTRVVNISDMAGQTKRDTEHVVQTTELIRQEAHQLNQLVLRFRL